MNANTEPKYYNFESLGIDRLIEILALWNRKITNMKATSIPIEKRQSTIIQTIRKVIKEKPDHEKFIKIKGYFAPKEKIEKKIDDKLSSYGVGDLVIHNVSKHRSKFVLAKVVKINEKSLTIQLDIYRTILDENAMDNQTWGTHRLIWNNNFNGDKVVIKNLKNIISKKDCIQDPGNNRYYLDLFSEGKQCCDYGN